MAQQSLYRRYRPRRFGEIKGQEHVVRALQNAVASESEGHAYLFSGPRGTGKTSTARILAKALNCTNLTEGEPCCECESCVSIEQGKSFDLFELDAASNNGVDAVRDLVERSAVSSPGRTKVYILDEVHMLTAAASNALLKTLEEPPDHVRFVLATTDPQKVLPTIRSRTQHFEFFLLSADELGEHVRWVAKDAGLDVDDDAVAYAVRQGKGSVRDTLSALDQVVAAGGVLVRPEPVEQLFEAMAGSDPGVAIVAVADAIAQGHDPRVLGEAFLSSVRDSFLVSLGVDTPHLVDADRERTTRWANEIGTPGLTRAMERVGQALVDMRTAADPRVPLEVALVQLTLPSDAAATAPTQPGATAEAPSGQSDAAADLD
ncbi:MAG: DNA polymerase III subunit gamma/tau, partial [Microthrixaceae bacterium]